MHKRTTVGQLLSAAQSDQLDTGWTVDRVLLNHAADHRQRGTAPDTKLTLSGPVCDRIAQLCHQDPTDLSNPTDPTDLVPETLDAVSETPATESETPVFKTRDESETPDPPAVA